MLLLFSKRAVLKFNECLLGYKPWNKLVMNTIFWVKQMIWLHIIIYTYTFELDMINKHFLFWNEQRALQWSITLNNFSLRAWIEIAFEKRNIFMRYSMNCRYCGNSWWMITNGARSTCSFYIWLILGRSLLVGFCVYLYLECSLLSLTRAYIYIRIIIIIIKTAIVIPSDIVIILGPAFQRVLTNAFRRHVWRAAFGLGFYTIT